MSIKKVEYLFILVLGLAVAAGCAGLTSQAQASVSGAKNLVPDGSFENAKLSPWRYSKVGGVKASGHLDKSQVHSGHQSFFISNSSPFHANVYTRVYQNLNDLKPNTTYRLSGWFKGRGVGQAWIGGGYPGWDLRKHTPKGNFGWTFVTMTFKTKAHQTKFKLMILLDSATKALWVDDVRLVQASQPGSVQLYIGSAVKGLPASARFYPAVPKLDANIAPVLKVRSASDKNFGMNISMNWSKKDLDINLNVLDPTHGSVKMGEHMYMGDSVQIAIDTRPLAPKRSEGYSASDYELGFALKKNGKVAHFAWHSGPWSSFDFSHVKATGHKTKRGYQLHISIPWQTLLTSKAKRPTILGMDILVNDGNGAHGRRYVQWTPGIGNGKYPAKFAHVSLISSSQKISGRLQLLNLPAGHMYDKTQVIVGSYRSYAIHSVPSRTLALVARMKNHTSINLGQIKVLALPANAMRKINFIIPAGALSSQGIYRLEMKPAGVNHPAAAIDVHRLNYNDQIKNALATLQKQYNQLQKAIQLHPAIASDSYLIMGMNIAKRYIHRVQLRGLIPKPKHWAIYTKSKITGGTAGWRPKHKQGVQWSLLQIQGIKQVINKTQKRVARLLSGKIAPQRVPMPAGGPVTIHNGVFYMNTTTGPNAPKVKRPVYLFGYGHFAQVDVDMPFLHKLGTTLIQNERGPDLMKPDGQLTGAARSITNVLQRARKYGIKMNMLLSPHEYPKWSYKQHPDMLLPHHIGFIHYIIDAPAAKRVIKTWINKIVPYVKNQPALLSFCLSNEPVYAYSGRDKWSRPLWTAYLKKHHPSLSALNKLYHSHYTSFEQIPVPPVKMPKKLDAKRRFYDWFRFNNKHFANWHAWMNKLVKQKAPNVSTEAKIMIFHTLDDPTNRHSLGVDPELFCDITDIAGCDDTAYPSQYGKYAYHWQHEQMNYDMLNSFRDQPVSNSENHLIRDRTPAVHIPSGDTYSVLWQGALHHLGETAIWCWNEPVSRSFLGSIYLRPANVYGAARAMLDLNRLAKQVAAINQSQPKVALLYSQTSRFWQKDYRKAVLDAYAALVLTGHPVTFISERQLASGQRSRANAKVKWVIFPKATAVKDSTIVGLNKFVKQGGHVIAIGANDLKYDQYFRPRKLPAPLNNMPHVSDAKGSQVLSTQLVSLFNRVGLSVPHLMVAGTKNPTWGVEYRTVKTNKGILVPMINFTHKPKTVSIDIPGNCRDLISGKQIDTEHITLLPAHPRLLLLSE